MIGCGNEPAPIPEEEIETIKTVLRSGALAESCPFLHEGQRVRVTHGSLEGIEGILIKKKNQCRMVISVHMLQRSISVEIEGHRLAAL